MITQTIQCDLLNNKPSENIIFRQGETGRVINFEILKDGVPVYLSAYDVAFSLYKPDGNFVIAECVVDDDTASVTETEQMTAVCGVGYFDLKISDNDEIIYTYNGLVLIDTPVITTEVINSLSEVFGLTFPDDFQEKLTAGENITIVDNVISATGGGGGEYTAGNYIDIVNNVIDVKTALINTINGKASQSDLTALSGVVSGKQDALTAGDYIDIVNNVIDVKTALINTINGKASQSDLTTLAGVVAGKANQSDLTALSGVVSGKQDALTAGSGIDITNNVISATGGGGGGSIDFDTPDYTFTENLQTASSTGIASLSLPTVAYGTYLAIIHISTASASTFTSLLKSYFSNSVSTNSILDRSDFPNGKYTSSSNLLDGYFQGYVQRNNETGNNFYFNIKANGQYNFTVSINLYKVD